MTFVILYFSPLNATNEFKCWKKSNCLFLTLSLFIQHLHYSKLLVFVNLHDLCICFVFFFHYNFFCLFVCFFQFVPFRDYIDCTGNHILSMARLAKDVLAEIPDQFLSYMRTRGIKPLPVPPPYTPPAQPLQTQIWGASWQCSGKKTRRIIFKVHRTCCMQNISPHMSAMCHLPTPNQEPLLRSMRDLLLKRWRKDNESLFTSTANIPFVRIMALKKETPNWDGRRFCRKERWSWKDCKYLIFFVSHYFLSS